MTSYILRSINVFSIISDLKYNCAVTPDKGYERSFVTSNIDLVIKCLLCQTQPV